MNKLAHSLPVAQLISPFCSPFLAPRHQAQPHTHVPPCSLCLEANRSKHCQAQQQNPATHRNHFQNSHARATSLHRLDARHLPAYRTVIIFQLELIFVAELTQRPWLHFTDSHLRISSVYLMRAMCSVWGHFPSTCFCRDDLCKPNLLSSASVCNSEEHS